MNATRERIAPVYHKTPILSEGQYTNKEVQTYELTTRWRNTLCVSRLRLMPLTDDAFIDCQTNEPSAFQSRVTHWHCAVAISNPAHPHIHGITVWSKICGYGTCGVDYRERRAWEARHLTRIPVTFLSLEGSRFRRLHAPRRGLLTGLVFRNGRDISIQSSPGSQSKLFSLGIRGWTVDVGFGSALLFIIANGIYKRKLQCPLFGVGWELCCFIYSFQMVSRLLSLNRNCILV